MLSMNVPKYLWGEAVLTAAYVINRVPSRVLNHETPLNCLKKCFPNNKLSAHLPFRVLGALFLFIYYFGQNLMLEQKSVFLLDMLLIKEGINVLILLQKKKTHITMDVSFVEHKPFFNQTHL